MTEQAPNSLFANENRESGSGIRIEANVSQEVVSQQLLDVLVDDLRSDRGEEEFGPYTEMRKSFERKFDFDYASLQKIKDGDVDDEEKGWQAEEITRTSRESAWHESQNKLGVWSEAINSAFDGNEESVRLAVDDLEKLYGRKFQTEIIRINLVPHFENRTYTTAIPKEQMGELVEFVPVSVDLTEDELGAEAKRILIDSLHEMSHQQLQAEEFDTLCEAMELSAQYQQIISKYFGGEKPYYDFVKEVVTNFIDGYIGRKYFGIQKKEGRPEEISPYTIADYVDVGIVDEYISSGRQIDAEFIGEVFRQVLEMEKV